MIEVLEDLFSPPASVRQNGGHPAAPTRPLLACGRWLSGGTPAKNRDDYWGGTIPWISAKSMTGLRISDSEDRVTELGASSGSQLVPAGTVLFVVRGMSLAKEFRVGVTERPVTFNQDLKGIIPSDDFDALYLAYYLKSRERAIMEMADPTSHGTLRLQTNLLEALPVPVLPLPDQRRIVSVLSAWDEAVADLTRLIAAKKRQRHGLAQRLLTGGVRLPGFEEEVQNQPLGRFLTLFSARNPSGQDLPILSCSKVHGIVPQSVIFGKRIASAETRHYKIVERGDLVYDPMLLWDASIGFVRTTERGLVSPAYTTFHLDETKADRGFFGHLFGGHVMRHVYKTISQGTNQRRRKAMPADFLKLEPRVPDLAEQRAIAAVLDAADAEIAALTAEHAARQRQKEGLTRLLLSGDIRLAPDAGDPS